MAKKLKSHTQNEDQIKMCPRENRSKCRLQEGHFRKATTRMNGRWRYERDNWLTGMKDRHRTCTIEQNQGRKVVFEAIINKKYAKIKEALNLHIKRTHQLPGKFYRDLITSGSLVVCLLDSHGKEHILRDTKQRRANNLKERDDQAGLKLLESTCRARQQYCGIFKKLW